MTDYRKLRRAFFISVVFNIAFVFLIPVIWFYSVAQGCVRVDNDRRGLLQRDIEVRDFYTRGLLFKLPQGLVVADASPTGMGWFEPHRFSIILTSDDPKLVDYSSAPKGGNTYSVIDTGEKK